MDGVTSRRRAGVLLHLTSLPAPHGGGGRMSEDAWRFVDWLAETGFSVWQILPLGPTHEDRSPYLSLSAFAGNPEMISLSRMLADQALADTWLGELLRRPGMEDMETLRRALRENGGGGDLKQLPDSEAFFDRNRAWLADYVAFMTLRHAQGDIAWWHWPEGLRHRRRDAIEPVMAANQAVSRALLVEQYLFDRQWFSLKAYANDKGIALFGDIPLYVAQDSVDVWANQAYFALDDEGQPVEMAGVPPDMFSEEGQVWGNPVFNWERLRENHFDWWIARIERQLALVDLVRIDHFRGLQAYWSIPAGEKTAVNGRWVEAPGRELLAAVQGALGRLPVVAEDLGYITAEVDRLREDFGIPCMRVLQFGFDGSPENPHWIPNVGANTVYYTGTHDNDTVISWFESLAPDAQAWIRSMLGIGQEDSILDAMVDGVLESAAGLAMLPMQDILGLGAGNRMNLPGTIEGNWRWRFQWEQLGDAIGAAYRRRLVRAGRIEDEQRY
ncbi:MAG TPA: 4-alpha-glucanotransferase [Gammaproteobacteria bacterium]|nr:4-alpha-glucanotransferase [Gammaproteobacteria bacterium]